MSQYVCLGVHVLKNEFAHFLEFVEEKWGVRDRYVKFEIENAMREWVDRDETLHQAEQELREALRSRGLSSSTESVGTVTTRGETRKLGHRVLSELKDEFARIAKQHYDDNLGAVLTRALRAYRKGGRRERILSLIQQLSESGSNTDTDDEAAENEATQTTLADTARLYAESESADSGGSAESQSDSTTDIAENVDQSVDAFIVEEIAGELGDEFLRPDLREEIRKKAGTDKETIEAYEAAVTSYKGVVPHPSSRNNLFIRKEKREEITTYGDLSRSERIEFIRDQLCTDCLVDQKPSSALEYTEVQDLFKHHYHDSPSHTYVYELMRDAAEAPGFNFDEDRTPSVVEVEIKQAGSEYLEAARTNPEVDEELVDALVDYDPIDNPAEPDTLSAESPNIDADVTTYSAGSSPPNQPSAADDD